MMDIAVIGRSDFTTGFRLAGVRKIYDVNSPRELEDKVRQCINDGSVGIVVLHAEDVGKLPQALQKPIDESVEPTFIAIGGREESGLRDKIKRAIGVDLWK
jgi:V/A-type H+-transporting ATPase subunit F